LPPSAQANRDYRPAGRADQLTVREMTDEQLLLIAQETAKQQALQVESAPLPEPFQIIHPLVSHHAAQP
jgi:hypothetical protein